LEKAVTDHRQAGFARGANAKIAQRFRLGELRYVVGASVPLAQKMDSVQPMFLAFRRQNPCCRGNFDEIVPGKRGIIAQWCCPSDNLPFVQTPARLSLMRAALRIFARVPTL
jgi:hypothetical protein